MTALPDAAGASTSLTSGPATTRSPSILSIEQLTKDFRLRGRGTGRVLRAVDDVTLELHQGETLGVVGESGCGKSTLANLIIGLETPSSGQIRFGGVDLARVGLRRRRRLGRDIQMVFQDPYGSVAPFATIAASIAEPLVAHGELSSAQRDRRVLEVMDQVGLARASLHKYPVELSGGQLQRVNIARALALSPKVVLLDEPVSALDVSIKAQIINLLADLQQQLGLTYLFISHDLSTLRVLSTRIAVMYLGRVVEIGESDEVYDRPQHPYTRALLDAVPVPDPVVQRRRDRIVLRTDLTSAIGVSAGCNFYERCPQAMEICRHERPARTTSGTTAVECHLVSGPDRASVTTPAPRTEA